MEKALGQGDLIMPQPQLGQANMHFNKVVDELINLKAKTGGYPYLI